MVKRFISLLILTVFMCFGCGGANEIEGVENVVSPKNGGVLESFTSEWGDDYGAAKLTDGLTNHPGWASTRNPDVQEFVYSFKNGQSAILKEAVIHSGTAEGKLFSKDVEVWISTDGNSWELKESGTLSQIENTNIALNLGETVASKIKLVITSGYRSDYWELGEFIVNGYL